MSKLILVFAVFFISVSEILARNCTKNEEYKTCWTGCKEYCGNKPFTCSTECEEGCHCKDGYIRKNNETNECILRSQCPIPKCPPNKEYKTCGSSCPPYCGEPQFKICLAVCVPECQCKDNYILKDGNSTQCILRSECPYNQTCSPHQRFTTCGSACPEYCGQPKDIVCTKQCVVGCECEPGYVKKSENCDDCCIPKSKCP